MKAPQVSFTAGGALALAGVVVAGVVLWRLRGANDKGDTGAQRVGAAAGAAVGDAAAGAVLGVGDSLGLPRTNADACQAALARGDLWEASFVCPAGEFLKGAYRTVINADNPQLPDLGSGSSGGATGSW